MTTPTIVLRDGSITLDRKLDLIFDKDPRNLDYRAMTLAPAEYEKVDKAWGAPPVTDQGQEGACVGHGCTQAACAHGGVVLEGEQTLDEYAQLWYHLTQHDDQWQGCSLGLQCPISAHHEVYSGTSVKAGGLHGIQKGLFSEIRWALGIDEVLKTLTTVGRVVFGVPWHQGMYEAPGGIVSVSGPQVGAHCIGADEIRWSTEQVIWQNSWGLPYGINGRAAISFTDLDALLQNGGECMVPIAAETGALSQ